MLEVVSYYLILGLISFSIGLQACMRSSGGAVTVSIPAPVLVLPKEVLEETLRISHELFIAHRAISLRIHDGHPSVLIEDDSSLYVRGTPIIWRDYRDSNNTTLFRQSLGIRTQPNLGEFLSEELDPLLSRDKRVNASRL